MAFTIVYDNKIVSEKNKEHLCSPADITLQVLNGCGKSGVARIARNALIDQGLNVLSFGNAKTFLYKNSVIIVRRMDEKKLCTLQQLLPIQHVYKQEKEPSLYDFIVVVGTDYKQYFKEI